MGTQEVVEGDKQGGHGDGAVAGGKTAGGTDVVLVGAVETLDELLKRPVLLGKLIEILQTQHLIQSMRG